MASLNVLPNQSDAAAPKSLSQAPDQPSPVEGRLPVEELQGSMIASETFKPKRGNTLSRRLLLTLMPTTLIPLVVAGLLGFQAEKRRAQQEALSLLQEEAVLASGAASDFVKDGFKLTSVIQANPIIQQALRDSVQIVEFSDLAEQEIGELESRFEAQKLLSPKPELNQYLADVAQVEGLGEISFTESNGFNLAYSQPTPDFVQKDERWWRQSATSPAGIHIGPPELDRKTNQMGVSLSQAIKYDQGELEGVMKSLIPTQQMDKRIQASITSSAVGASQAVQIVDAQAGIPFNLIEPAGVAEGSTQIIGGSTIAALAIALVNDQENPDKTIEQRQADIAEATNISGLNLNELTSLDGDSILTALASIGSKTYSLASIPGTNWVAIASVDVSEVESAGNELIKVFASTTALLSLAAVAVLLLLARQLSLPLKALTTTAQEATAGNLDIRAKLEGTAETQTLGQTFNLLLNQIQDLLAQQEQAATEQQKLREELEEDINLLMEDVSGAADGDLSVRAKLSEGDVGIIADLFNAIIENLRITTLQVKASTGKVTSSLVVNEVAIRELADQAMREAESLQETMEAVEDISSSIQEVAVNAGQASRLTQDTFSTVQSGTESMDQTVGSILGLRSTVGETAKKIKRLGESAQKISQAVGLIDEIALKTNLLAVNASVEAARAGEMGQGFTAVAEQVGSLAAQSSAATQEIAQIVASIQMETQEVVESIEIGTAQVVESTNLVEQTKERLAEVLSKSEQINELMKQISASTAYQTESSAAVTQLVKLATEESQERSKSSLGMAQAIQKTAEIARALEVSVEQFKVNEQPEEAESLVGDEAEGMTLDVQSEAVLEPIADGATMALASRPDSEEPAAEDVTEFDAPATGLATGHPSDESSEHAMALDAPAEDFIETEAELEQSVGQESRVLDIPAEPALTDDSAGAIAAIADSRMLDETPDPSTEPSTEQSAGEEEAATALNWNIPPNENIALNLSPEERSALDSLAEDMMALDADPAQESETPEEKSLADLWLPNADHPADPSATDSENDGE